MNGILTKDGYRIIQHEDTGNIIIFKDGRRIKEVQTTGRPMKEAEILAVFDFLKDKTSELEEQT